MQNDFKLKSCLIHNNLLINLYLDDLICLRDVLDGTAKVQLTLNDKIKTMLERSTVSISNLHTFSLSENSLAIYLTEINHQLKAHESGFHKIAFSLMLEVRSGGNIFHR